MGVFIIAEAGVNHNGSLDNAIKLCDIAKDAGVDAVKFQTWKTENIVTRSSSLAEYQDKNVKDVMGQFDMLKSLELQYEDFIKIARYCEEIGIEFLSTPDDSESLDFLCNLGLSILKIGSGEVSNIPYLRKIGAKRIPIILSTGMSNLSMVETAVSVLRESGAPKITLLHCTTNYPCPYNEVNLNAMLTLKNAFKCSVGYSDHTMGIEVPIAAVALGAEVIEKHFTIDRTLPGPDHKASLNPAELKQMVVNIRNIEMAMGDGIKRPNNTELQNAKVVLKRIVAKTHISIGQVFSPDNITVKRCDNGITANYWDLIIGKTAKHEFEIDNPIEI